MNDGRLEERFSPMPHEWTQQTDMMRNNAAKLLDRWEEACLNYYARERTGPLSGILRRIQPWRKLQPSEPYSEAAYLVYVLRSAGPIYLIEVIALLAAPALMMAHLSGWRRYILSGDPFAQASLIRAIWSNVPSVVYSLAIAILFIFCIQFPQYYFWNRRADRLRREGVPETQPASLPVDETIWPPAPTGNHGQ